jgi:thiol peroxidase
MSERTTTMRGNELPLTGPELHVGDPAPEFTLVQRSEEGLKDVTLADYSGKTLILSVVPSLDTPVCEMQTKKFNEEVVNLPANIEILTVSMDLPFAQYRFCNDKSTYHVKTASDHRTGEFGQAYGTLIEPLRLESRAVFVVGPDGTLRHAQYVPEVTDQPDYEAALQAARESYD